MNFGESGFGESGLNPLNKAGAKRVHLLITQTIYNYWWYYSLRSQQS